MFSDSDHLFFALADQGDFDRLSLLLEAGHLPPLSLVHRTVILGPGMDVLAVVSLFVGRAKTAALEWRDVTGESAIDVAVRRGDWETADLLKKVGATAREPEKNEDKTSSASLMAAVALGRQYKLEPVASIFKEEKKKKKK